MKNIFALAAMMAATLTLSSCEKGTVQPLTPTDGAPISISFVASDDTRGFGDSTAEPWEKEVKTATIMVFDTPGKLVYRRDLSAAEITAITTAPIALAVPGVKVGDNCTFALIANFNNLTVPITAVTKAQVEAISIGTYEEYVYVNSRDIFTASPRQAGFEMSAMTTQAITAGTTAVSLVLKRCVAKVDVKCATTPAFTAKYGKGTLTITRGCIQNSRLAQDDLYQPSVGIFSDRTLDANCFDVMDTDFDKDRCRFYFFSNDEPLALYLYATYDIDGNPATTGDRTDLDYYSELTGSEYGYFYRNKAYLIDVRIDGLTGEDVNTSVKVADWETLVTQVVNVGN